LSPGLHPAEPQRGDQVGHQPVDDQTEAGHDERDAAGDKDVLPRENRNPAEQHEEPEHAGEAEPIEHTHPSSGRDEKVPLSAPGPGYWSFKPLAPEKTGMSDNEGRTDLRMPEDAEVFAVVTDMLGANRVRVRCMDGTERTARIPGKMQKRIWIREDDVVLVEPWDWQDEKGDITWRYEKQEADQLREEGHIQQ
jgi:translation initiation factor 1A